MASGMQTRPAYQLPPTRDVLIALGLALTLEVALFLRVAPALDPVIEVPVGHFYIVTFTSFVAFVISALIVYVVGSLAESRVLLLVLAFAGVAAFFTVHGVTTPDVLVDGFHPGIAWSAWLSLLVGIGFLTLSTLDPGGPVLTAVDRHRRGLLTVLVAVYAGYVAVVALAPQALTDIQAALGDVQLGFAAVALTLAAVGIIRAGRAYLRGGGWVSGLVLLNLLLLAEAQVSQLGTVWRASWWLYHVLMLVGFLVTVAVLVARYESLRSFHLTPYFAATSAVLIALLGLAGGEVGTRLLRSAGSLPTGERTTGIVVSAVLLGLLFVGLVGIVARAERILRRRTDDLRRANDQLRESERLRAELARMMAHDLRGPLTAIMLDVDAVTANGSPLEARDRERLSRAQSSAGRLMGMVDTLLDHSRLEAGTLPLEPQPTAISALVEEVVGAQAGVVERAGLTVECDLPDGLPPVVVDRAIICRVLDNLLGNAIKHSPRGDHVRIAAARTDGGVRLAVTDAGPGVPAALRERIFEPFVQDPNERSRRRGIGLGLAFSRLAVEAHGGTIGVEPAPEGGSTFYFTLPCGSGTS